MDSAWKPGSRNGKTKRKKDSGLDDILGDLLSNDDDLPSSKPVKSVKDTVGIKKKTRGTDEEFYSSLAALADDPTTSSDISEADAVEMARGLDDLDAMDENLFPTKKNLQKEVKTPKKEVKKPQKEVVPNMPSKATEKRTATVEENDWDSPVSSESVPAQPKTVSGTMKREEKDTKRNLNKPAKKFDFGDFDEDDPLAGLLSDEDDPTVAKKKSNKKQAEKVQEVAPEPANTHSEPVAEPSVTPRKTKKKEADILFDDDDVLGGMGFDSPRQQRARVEISEERPARAKSALDTLLGKSSDDANESLSQPSTEKKRFVLDKKYAKMTQEKSKVEPKDEDFQFGGYMPTAATEPQNVRKSVRFNDVGEDSKAGGSGRRSRAGMSSTLDQSENGDDFLDSLISEKSSRSKANISSGDQSDWLGFTNEKPKKEPQKHSDQSDWLGTDTKNSEKVKDSSDWLGLTKEVPIKETQKHKHNDPSDWLGTDTKSSEKVKDSSDLLGITKEVPIKETQKDKHNDPSDWLGTDTKSSDKVKDSSDWLGLTKEVPIKETQKHKHNDPTDWLGTDTKSSEKVKDSSDWLGLTKEVPIKETQKHKHNDPSDWLGTDMKSSEKVKDSSDWLGLNDSGDPTTTNKQNDPSDYLAISGDSEIERSGKIVIRESKRQQNQRQYEPADDYIGLGQTTGDRISMPPQQQNITLAQNLVNPNPKARPAQQNAQADQGKAHSETSSIITTSQGNATNMLTENVRWPGNQTEYLQLKQQQELRDSLLRQEQMLLQQQQQSQQIVNTQQTLPFQSEDTMASRLIPPSPVAVGVGTYLPQQQHPAQHPPHPESSTKILELQNQVRRLEIEKSHIESMLDSANKHHQEELNALETSSKARLLEENRLLHTQITNKTETMEQEKSDLIQQHFKKYENWEKEKVQEIERLRELHREAIEALRKEHEEHVSSLKRVKEQELEAVTSAHSHSRSLHAVMEQMQSNAKDLGELQHTVHVQHQASQDERHLTAMARDEQLKALQERHAKQQKENESERAALQELIVKMEVQLREQQRISEQEKWKVRQETNKMEALQMSLAEEKRILVEQVQREKEDIQRAKESLLNEQKAGMSQLYEERRALAEERSQLTISQRMLVDRGQRESVRKEHIEGELEGTVKMITDMKAKFQERQQKIQQEQEDLAKIRVELEHQKKELELEKMKLKDMAMQLQERSQNIEGLAREAAKVKGEGDKAIAEAKNIEMDHNIRLEKIQLQLTTLRDKEKVIAQERISLCREKRDLRKSLCINCHMLLRNQSHDRPNVYSGIPVPKVNNNSGISKIQLNSGSFNNNSAQELGKNLMYKDQMYKSQLEMKHWEIESKRDQEFLKDEEMFKQIYLETP
ncbi:unnamed protein product [Owenia fusiformis]|uniref:Fas-binding factor 1 C-terminal domain-containing protein n=1 Tax=Owenia fusiformis TaxID=6347 RepID=A0A8S4PIY8_OWEFU|nr:unnamed protein product [Owenia fusiformis]